MECKVKIGISYEPKWFERRYTQGTYSAKNVAHDEETVWIQHAMLGTQFKRKSYTGWIVSAVAIVSLFVFIYGV